jgi:cation:H+ antiporter
VAVLAVAALVVGVVVTAAASRRAVASALEVSDALGVSAGVVGVTVLAIGTDLPEIANSISASVAGHGDLNVGDGTGSALTQITLILTILLVFAGSQLELRQAGSRVATTTGTATVIALLVLAVMLSDGMFSRVDGLLLVVAWVVSVLVVHRGERGLVDTPGPRRSSGSAVAAGITQTLWWLVVVGVGAIIVVRAFVDLADRFNVPEFVASAVVLSVGTSLPELVVDWTAIRRGASALAIGDLFGSSLVDSTLSVGIGPLVRATPVSQEAMIGTLVIAAGCALATMIAVLDGPPRPTGLALFAVYVGATAVLVTLAA